MEAKRVMVHVVGAGWVELHHGFLFVPEEGFHRAHLFPSGAALERLQATIADGDRDVFPFGAGEAWAISIRGDDKKAVGAGWYEERAISVAVAGFVAGGLDAVVVWEVHLRVDR